MKVAFLDRDGVINEELNYVSRPEDFHILPGVINALSLLKLAGYKLIVITNQAGIARGYYNEGQFQALCNYMREQFSRESIWFEHIYFCPHHPTAGNGIYRQRCNCRKPLPGMLMQAAQDYPVDFSQSVLIGDKISDIQAGMAAGVGKTILVRSGHSINEGDAHLPDHVCDNLLEAARWITENNHL